MRRFSLFLFEAHPRSHRDRAPMGFAPSPYASFFMLYGIAEGHTIFLFSFGASLGYTHSLFLFPCFVSNRAAFFTSCISRMGCFCGSSRAIGKAALKASYNSPLFFHEGLRFFFTFSFLRLFRMGEGAHPLLRQLGPRRNQVRPAAGGYRWRFSPPFHRFSLLPLSARNLNSRVLLFPSFFVVSRSISVLVSTCSLATSSSIVLDCVLDETPPAAFPRCGLEHRTPIFSYFLRHPTPSGASCAVHDQFFPCGDNSFFDFPLSFPPSPHIERGRAFYSPTFPPLLELRGWVL